MLKYLLEVITQYTFVGTVASILGKPVSKLKFKIAKKKHLKWGLRVELSNEDSDFMKELMKDIDKVENLYSCYQDVQYPIGQYYSWFCREVKDLEEDKELRRLSIESESEFEKTMKYNEPLKKAQRVFARYIIQGVDGFVMELNCLGLFYLHLKEPDLVKAKRISDMIGGLKRWEQSKLKSKVSEYKNESDYFKDLLGDVYIDFNNIDEYLEQIIKKSKDIHTGSFGVE